MQSFRILIPIVKLQLLTPLNHSLFMQLSHLHTSPYISIDYASILIPMTLLTTPQDRHPSTGPIIDTINGSRWE